jgi:hypothetical protein
LGLVEIPRSALSVLFNTPTSTSTSNPKAGLVGSHLPSTS